MDKSFRGLMIDGIGNRTVDGIHENVLLCGIEKVILQFVSIRLYCMDMYNTL